MKKNIVIAILLIITVLLGGTLYYQYTNQNKIYEKCKEETKESKEQTTQKSFDVKNKSIIQELVGNYDNFYRIYVSKEGDAFLTVSSTDNLPIENKEHIKKLQEQYTPNTINGYCNVDEPELRKDICEDNDNVMSIKLDTSNVIAAYNIINGQDTALEWVLFLKSDGTVDALNIGMIIWNKEEVIIHKNIGNLKNIVSIVETGTTGVPSGHRFGVAIENDGTQHDLTEYLLKY